MAIHACCCANQISGSTCALEIADVPVFTECLCDVLGAEPLLGAPSDLHHATPGEKNKIMTASFVPFFSQRFQWN